MTPNQSGKLIANGMSGWPSSAGPSVLFAFAVQRATSSSPAYLKRWAAETTPASLVILEK